MQRKPNLYADMCREYHDVLIAALRHVAYRCGYAIGVHGTLARDIDLIACPWRESPVSAHYLAEKIQAATKEIIGFARVRECDPNPTKKPCGRLAWSFYLTHDDAGPYIDLSVMPKGPEEETKGAKSEKKRVKT